MSNLINIDLEGKKASLQEWEISKEIDGYIEQIVSNDSFEFYEDDYKYLLEAAVSDERIKTGTLTSKCGVNLPFRMLNQSGNFDMKKCIFKKKIDLNNVLVFKESYNIFDYEKFPDVDRLQGDLTREYYINEVFIANPAVEPTLEQGLNQVGGIQDRTGEGFYIEFVELVIEPRYSGGLFPFYIFDSVKVKVAYVRVSSAVPFPGWVYNSILGLYVYPIEMPPYKSELKYYFDDISLLRIGGTWTAGKAGVYGYGKISNVHSIKDMLAKIFGPTYVSNFYNVNPDGTQPVNEYYDYAETYLHNLGIAESYDVIRASAVTDSYGKSGLIDIEKVISGMSTMMNTKLVYYPAENIIRHEHVSYFQAKGIELSGNYELEPIEINENAVKFEKWTMAAKTKTEGHYSTRIDYDPHGKEDKNYVAEILLTDFPDLYENVAYVESGEMKNFFVLLAVTDDYKLISNNDVLKIRDLVTLFHNIGRPSRIGNQDLKPVLFDNKSLGMTGKVTFHNTLKNWINLHLDMAVKLEEGVFYIKDSRINQDDSITLKIYK